MVKKFAKNLTIWINKIVLAKSYYKVPFFKRIYLNCKGFHSDQYVMYDLAHNDINEYLSSFERWKSREISGIYKILMDDKLVFSEVFAKYIRTPELYAYVRNGQITGLNHHTVTTDTVFEFLRELGMAVLKPVNGAGGYGVFIIRYTGTNFIVNEKPARVSDLKKIFDTCGKSVLCEFIVQSDYENSLFSKTTNTIRIVTAKVENGRFDVVAAAQRIGREKSVPVDNATSGGLVADINLETGILGRAASYISGAKNEMIFYSNHPDTNAQIAGKQIPKWDELKNIMIHIAAQLPYINFTAWDIVFTEKGPCVIEANTSSGLDLFQIWGGQKNGPIGKVFRLHGIIK